MRRKSLAYVKTVRARGKVYYYFDTGETNIEGKKIYRPLPPKGADNFGSVYAAYLGHRTRKSVGELTVPKLVGLYQASTEFARLAPNTQRLYRRYHKLLCQWLPTARAEQIERKDVLAMMDRMADRPGAANMLRASIAALYTWARRRSHVTNRPADDIEKLGGGEHEPWPETLVAEALADQDHTIRLAVHLLYFTAQRISDVVAMRWAQFGDGAVEVTVKKTKRTMTIAMHPALATALEGKARDLRTVLLKPNGKPYSESALRYLLQRWADVKGYKVVPHGLRKNAVNALLEAGCTVAETAAVSGQSLQLVEHYAKRRNGLKLSSAAMLKWAGTPKGSDA